MVAMKLTAMTAGVFWPLPNATATPHSTRLVSRMNRKRRRDMSASPAARQDRPAPAGPQAIEPTHDGVGGHEQQDQRLDDRDDIDRHLGQELHAGRPVAQ